MIEDNSVGFIGAGNMGRALIQSLLAPKKLSKLPAKTGKPIIKNRQNKIAVFDLNQSIKKYFPQSRISWMSSPKQVIDRSSIVFLCIKPKDVKDFFSINRKYFDKQIVISIIAGLTISSLRKIAGLPKLKVCRIMPNLAAAVAQSVGTVTYSRNINNKEKQTIQAILSTSGLYLETRENLVNAVTSISGCGPAFVFLFIEALTQAAVSLKLPRKQALRFATETVVGSSSLLKASGQDPLELTNRVTSPGGMTIEGVKWLNNSDFQKIVTEAVKRSHTKAKELFNTN